MKLTELLNDDAVDELITDKLMDCIEDNYELYTSLRDRGALETYEQEDMYDALNWLLAAKVMWKYYSLSEKHHKLDKFKVDYVIECTG